MIRNRGYKVSLTSIADIFTQPQMRKTYDKDLISILADTIEEVGLIHPIILQEAQIDGKTKYLVVAGHRRLKAFRELAKRKIKQVIADYIVARKKGKNKLSQISIMKWIRKNYLRLKEEAYKSTRIPARVFKALTEQQFLAIQASENSYVPVPPEESAIMYESFYRRLVACYGTYSLEKFSKLVGRDTSTLRNALRFAKLDVETRKWVADGVLRYSCAAEIAKISSVAKQKEFAVYAVAADLRFPGVKKMVANYFEELSSPQLNLEQMFYATAEELEQVHLRGRKYRVDLAGNMHMSNAVLYWAKILYLHERGVLSQDYQPFTNPSVRASFSRLCSLVDRLKPHLTEYFARKSDDCAGAAESRLPDVLKARPVAYEHEAGAECNAS